MSGRVDGAGVEGLQICAIKVRGVLLPQNIDRDVTYRTPTPRGYIPTKATHEFPEPEKHGFLAMAPQF